MSEARSLTTVRTLPEAVARRSIEDPLQLALVAGDRAVSCGELWTSARGFARALADSAVHQGDRVVLALPNGPEFVAALLGVHLIGTVAVPISPASGPDRIRDLATGCGARAVVLEETGDLARALDVGPAPAVVTPAQAAAAPPHGPWTEIDPDSLALIQYTSGSTGDPRGVTLRHRDLMTNVRQMVAGMEITRGEVMVSFLPVHHDMGLVLMVMVPLVLGARLVLLESRLTDPGRWLDAVAEHRGTFTAAPDFAYRVCLRTVRDPSRHDLSSLRVALNAAEPVRASTIRRFEEAFGLERVVVAGYGLAEATVGVAMQPPGTTPVVSDRGFVAVGRTFPDVRVRVVDGDRELGPDATGELVVESPANTSGYYRNPDATERLFWRPGAIRTGDLGYRDPRGNLFVVGRTKNIILQAGRNLAPLEIEETVEALPFVRRAAAVGIDRGGVEGELAHVFVELRRAQPPPEPTLREMARQVVESIDRRLGLRPGRVILLRRRSIPLTGNGKIRHGELRRRCLEGELEARGAIVFPTPHPPDTA